MHALILAAGVAALQAAAPPPAHNCGTPQTSQAASHAPMGPRKLGDLPDAVMELAVLRSIDGCWVRQVVRFNVSQKTPPTDNLPGVEIPGYTGRLVPMGPVKPLQRVGP
jgi:hypothetical protein